MRREHIRAYIIVFSAVFLILFFVTWQQVTIFRLGYTITSLQEKIRKEEIKKQHLMKEYHGKYNLYIIEDHAKKSFKMDIPRIENCRVLRIKEAVPGNDKKRRNSSLVACLKDMFSPADAEAR
ncbi:MAG: hypothetical protein ABIH89_01670 [Elusimicrobiota bacterium]